MTRIPAKESIGKKYGHLLVLGIDHHRKWGGTFMLCQCDCGNTTTVWLKFLRNGSTKSCGCAHYGENAGCSSHSLYKRWNAIKHRCCNPICTQYKDYGGRGIKVCEQWLDFKTFKKDIETIIGLPSAGMTLDRINNNGNYEPGNIKWSTRKEQMNNTRRNHYFTHDGKTLTLAQWGDHLNLKLKKVSLCEIKKALGLIPNEFHNRNITITHNGETHDLKTWAKMLEISFVSIYGYIKRGVGFSHIVQECEAGKWLRNFEERRLASKSATPCPL